MTKQKEMDHRRSTRDRYRRWDKESDQQRGMWVFAKTGFSVVKTGLAKVVLPAKTGFGKNRFFARIIIFSSK